MTALELRASLGLAGVYALRMLGMFLILPIFAIYAETLPGGASHLMIGLALGAYGLTQAMFQLPFGMASDRYGRKKVIYFGLMLFAIGSLVAAMAHDIVWVMIGRAIQGFVALISAPLAKSRPAGCSRPGERRAGTTERGASSWRRSRSA